MTSPFRFASRRLLASFAFALTAALFAGCASKPLPPPTASAAAVEQLRAARLAPAMVGTFSLAAGKKAEMDRTLYGLRAATLSPSSGTFSQQLKDELVVDLKAAGLYGEKSPVVIAGQLTDSMVDAGMSTGTGRLAARIMVTRAGASVFDKEIVAESSWESSFVGAIAIPAAINNYGALYKSLIAKLIDDPDFRRALASN